MDLLNRLLGHDAWTTRRLLELCLPLTDEQLDRDFDIGHRTIRGTFDHVIRNMEIWSSLMAGEDPVVRIDCSVTGMIERLNVAAARLASVARDVADRRAWDATWLDRLDDPPQHKSFGGSIAHVITHSMHHRAQLLFMLRRTGLANLPEGDVLSWEGRRDQPI